MRAVQKHPPVTVVPSRAEVDVFALAVKNGLLGGRESGVRGQLPHGNSLAFGASGWLRPMVGPVLSNPIGVAALTWIPLFIEISLAAALLVPQRVRYVLLAAGAGFHLCIAVMMRLWSFALAMWAGLLLLCLPLGGGLRLREPHAGHDSSAQQSRSKATALDSDKPASRAAATS